jgi:hypothetical protein
MDRPLPRLIGVIALAAAMSLSSAALAGTFTEDLSAAQTALAAEDFGAAEASIASAEAAAVNLEGIAQPGLIARVHYLRGMQAHLTDANEAAMNHWRTALLIDNAHQWDEGIAKDDRAQDLFEALRAEVRDRPDVDAMVPPLLGLAELYIDGGRVCPGDTVQEGLHLAQVSCPEDRVYGQWADFPRKKMKWLKMCPNGVDVNAVPAPKEESEGDMFGLGDALGGEDEGCPLPGDAPEEVAAVAPVPTEAPPASGNPLIQRSVSWPMVAAGTGLLLGGGVALGVAGSRRAEFRDPGTVYNTTADVEAAAKKVNGASWLGTGLTVAGGGLCVAAVIPW